MQIKHPEGFIKKSLEEFISPIISTYGPYGNSVLIESNDKPILTKDGLTVAKHLGNGSTNPVIANVLSNLITMESLVGDGTTTMSLLIKSMYDSYVQNLKGLTIPFSRYFVVQYLDQYKNAVLSFLKTIAIKVDHSNEDLIKSLILTITNNDSSIADLLFKNRYLLSQKGNFYFNKLDNTAHSSKYMEVQGYMLSKERCSVEFHRGDTTNCEVHMLVKFDISILKGKKNVNLLVFTNTPLTAVQKKLLEDNKDYNITVLYVHNFTNRLIEALTNIDPYKQEGGMAFFFTNSEGTFFLPHTKGYSEDNLEYLDDLPYVHHFFYINEKDSLLFEEKCHRIEDCIKVLSSPDNHKLLVGAGVSLKRASTDLFVMNKDLKTSEERLASQIIQKGLDTPILTLERSKPPHIQLPTVYDSLDVVLASFEYAVETIKSLILTNYILLKSE